MWGPVLVAQTGHTYERAGIERWLRVLERPTYPMSALPLPLFPYLSQALPNNCLFPLPEVGGGGRVRGMERGGGVSVVGRGFKCYDSDWPVREGSESRWDCRAVAPFKLRSGLLGHAIQPRTQIYTLIFSCRRLLAKLHALAPTCARTWG